jgi:hypothetical protein
MVRPGRVNCPKQKLPVDPVRQYHLLVAHMDDLIEPEAEQIALASRSRFLWLHGMLQITIWSGESHSKPASSCGRSYANFVP